MLDHFQVLSKEQMKAETFVIDPGMHGQRYTRLAWFWSLDVNKVDDPYMVEFTRVHWLRAKCKQDRWQEEATILYHEINWTIQWFKNQSRIWLGQMTSSEGSDQQGKRCYAAKQAAMWQKMAENGETAFEAVCSDFLVIRGWK
ncbi:hypothetical protein JAAARDRAFT_141647 [Jaapia argillacea MUCL 33604]|uniref:Uncharacterized protein n=1 Tax=Jaapia argillacea MUCL 33604 TaxID=933084 RepID=A0A067PI00_9AGAM|nr:hypothetical protein JAAARDRAFT_141647 [Jaapia argillacea MUCL 33604]